MIMVCWFEKVRFGNSTFLENRPTCPTSRHRVEAFLLPISLHVHLNNSEIMLVEQQAIGSTIPKFIPMGKNQQHMGAYYRFANSKYYTILTYTRQYMYEIWGWVNIYHFPIIGGIDFHKPAILRQLYIYIYIYMYTYIYIYP